MGETHFSIHAPDKAKTKFLITGHSLGAATANLLAAMLNEDAVYKPNTYCFTFACPNVTKSPNIWGQSKTANYANVYNFINPGDPVTQLPQDIGLFQWWGKFGPEFPLYTPYAQWLDAHKVGYYVDYAQSLAHVELNKVNSIKMILLNIDCPVDVEINSNTDDLIGRIVNNKVDESVTKIAMAVIGETKQVFLSADKKYTVKLTGSNTGTMTYSAHGYDIISGEHGETKMFSNVVLSGGKLMQSQVGSTIDVPDVRLFVMNDQDRPIAEVNTDGSETDLTGMTDAQAVAADKVTLTWDAIKGANTAQNNVTFDLSLPTTGVNGSTIAWTSSNPATISAIGAVNRPSYSAGNQTLTLIATITNGSVSDTKTFILIVTAQPYLSPYTPPTTTNPPDTTISDIMPPLTDGWDNPYIDVVDTDWFYDAVCFVAESELMEGTSASMFSPNVTMSRAMLVTLLWRLEGKPEIEDIYDDYTDVVQGSWYEVAVGWAAQNEIVLGYPGGFFKPDDPVTREQAVTVLYRYAIYKGLDVGALADLSRYIDMDDISYWALDAMKWAIAVGIIQGRTVTTTVPQGTSTRAEIAMIFKRYIEDFLVEDDEPEE